MKNNLLKDVRIAANFLVDMRRARKNGNEVKVNKVVTVPYMQCGTGFLDTAEGCTLSWLDKEIVDAARMAFNGLSPEERRRLSSSPEDGEFIERVHVWKEILVPVMTKKQCHIATNCIIEWYIHIKQMRKEGKEKSA